MVNKRKINTGTALYRDFPACTCPEFQDWIPGRIFSGKYSKDVIYYLHQRAALYKRLYTKDRKCISAENSFPQDLNISLKSGRNHENTTVSTKNIYHVQKRVANAEETLIIESREEAVSYM